MDDVTLDVCRKHLPYRPFIGLGWIRGSHDLSEMSNGVVSLENHGHTRAFRHKVRQASKKRPFSMNGIKALGLRLGHMKNLESHDTEAFRFETGKHPANDLLVHAVGLDDG